MNKGRDGEDQAMRETNRYIEMLKSLHDQVIPKQYRTRNYIAAQNPYPDAYAYPRESRERWEYLPDVWFLFLGNCIMYDPPDDQLEDFAEAANGERYTQARLAPIVWRSDSVAVAETEVWFRDQLIDYFHMLYGAFLAEHGLQAAFQQFSQGRGLDEYAELVRVYQERRKKIEPEPYISIEDDPDIEMIRKALDTLRKQSGTSRQRGRPKRDSLRCVQCAILKDRYHWDEAAIARLYGWQVSEGDYDEPRSGTARVHVAEGREILVQRKYLE